MFNKVLIANRGAIAVRIIRTLKKLGVQSIVIYSEDDRHSLHVRQADHAYSLGPGNVSDTYLNQEKIFNIIEKSGAEAVHPGYGFLSENAEFVEACESRGIVFIGPRVEQMAVFGLKHSARQLAEDNAVPLLKGSPLLASVEDALAAANEVGYPVMLKSTAGGGGIGMQVCQDEQSLASAFESVKRLSSNNFSNDGVFIEKYIEYARHIEVQVLGDGKGNVIALGERDCSAQRRNQKVIEETPAPNLSDKTRKALADTAKTLVAAVDYRNVGTVEFIVDQKTEAHYFLEVNTRLQVEHGVTEEIFGVDLVEWMLLQAANELGDIAFLEKQLKPSGHALQVRLYAENPAKQFQPSAGLLSAVTWPDVEVRLDTWIETGLTVSPNYDPMLAKIIFKAPTREEACEKMRAYLASACVEGIETNKDYLCEVLDSEKFKAGRVHTRYLADLDYQPKAFEVLNPGTMTTVQDYPGRLGYWCVGVPPSGPFDNFAFQLGNRILGNDVNAAGLELTLNGPSLKFFNTSTVILCGAEFDAELDGKPVSWWTPFQIEAGQVLKIGSVAADGARAYLLFTGGIKGERYLGSQSTFTLGQFGGFSGRALRAGDVLHLNDVSDQLQTKPTSIDKALIDKAMIPQYGSRYELRVIYGPHGAPDFFESEYIDTFFETEWQVHYNSSRTGVRLIGPKPLWTRTDGGEAGMHPSNIHDNAYAVGAIDFTGDMPVILGPDGPSLGGFVCPATVIAADLWKLGQLKAGDVVCFKPISPSDAKTIELSQKKMLNELNKVDEPKVEKSIASPILKEISSAEHPVGVVYRVSGDKNVLIEYGPLELDIRLRFRVHVLMQKLQTQMDNNEINGIRELTPGIRSLQVQYDNLQLSLDDLLAHLIDLENSLSNINDLQIESRIVHLPLSWDDEACQLAIEKYMQSVRKDAPWCPSNLEFIRRINGLDSVEAVKQIVYAASYVVMGLGDVYLGAPVATPLDPRRRLVTTKYNPARTWTAENSVGIGGGYLCVYGMEGPGGYQFVGRTLQMWNRFRKTAEFDKPWLLRFFDQIRFYEVSHEELDDIRDKFLYGNYPIKIEKTSFNLQDYDNFMQENAESIQAFVEKREAAFKEELDRWVANGQMNFSVDEAETKPEAENDLPDNCEAIMSTVAGNVWEFKVAVGDTVAEGDVVCILESMKMEIEIHASQSGTVVELIGKQGSQVSAGQTVVVVEVKS